ncbi:DgyrCDS8493 [Dimorphilus gyrociliatus]|uniref:DgyrCDS8493 n=1 Tax=Dimorphilus gyrociliatus TaxID=2664684 RepID=A0A7I8VUD1_9ANNE|nr:DgyrCDS8493 [Dimorphilus gyrociliatus]
MYRAFKQETHMQLKAVIIVGSVRQNRLADRVLKMILATIQNSYECDVIDPLVMPFGFVKTPIFHYDEERNGAPQWLIKAEKLIKESDAIVVITPEYNHSLSPIAASIIDHFGVDTYKCKASAVVSYSIGKLGGIRAADQGKILLNKLGAICVPHVLSISEADKKISQHGVILNKSLLISLKKLMKDLKWYTMAFKTQRERFGELN